MPAPKRPELAAFFAFSLATAVWSAPEAKAASAFYVDTSPSDHTCSVWFSRATGLALVYDSKEFGKVREILSRPCLVDESFSSYADQHAVHLAIGDRGRVCDYTPTGEIMNDRALTTVRCHSKKER